MSVKKVHLVPMHTSTNRGPGLCKNSVAVGRFLEKKNMMTENRKSHMSDSWRGETKLCMRVSTARERSVSELCYSFVGNVESALYAAYVLEEAYNARGKCPCETGTIA